jgi:hypothetical protein
MKLCNHTTRSQEARIIDWLAAGHSINPMQALRKFGSFRLGARIYGLRKDGHKIESARVTRRGKTFAEYRLAQ